MLEVTGTHSDEWEMLDIERPRGYWLGWDQGLPSVAPFHTTRVAPLHLWQPPLHP